MCSIGDDDIEDTSTEKYMPEKSQFSLAEKCNKCRLETPCVVLRSKDKYCKSCFQAGTVHKFKALLGKHKLIRPNERVLVLHKGGHPSTAMLHFLRTGLDLDTHKKLRFHAEVLFIENLYHLGLEERLNVMLEVFKECQKFNFKTYFTSLARICENQNLDRILVKDPRCLEIHGSDKEVVNKFLSQQSSRTNKNDFLNIFVRKNLIEIAKFLNCKFLFTPELSADIASQLLSDFSLGRGSHAPLDTGFCDSRDENVKILRPLRFFDTKELAFYNYFNDLQPVAFQEPQNQTYNSVQSLMRKFVADLQINYPATVTTVLKTGDKLGLSGDFSNKCKFCQGPVEAEKSSLLAAESIEFSHLVSTQAPDYDQPREDRYSKLLNAFTSSKCNKYCYSCRKLNI